MPLDFDHAANHDVIEICTQAHDIVYRRNSRRQKIAQLLRA
jgi:hypothetical protein